MKSLRIGTWNLDHARGAKHDQARLEVLAEADADIWVLTETNDRLALPGYTAVHCAPRPASLPGGRWVSVWTRAPLVQPVETADRNRSAAALVSTAIGQVLVFGTVLPWHADVGEPPRNPLPRAWEEHHRVLAEQGREWADLKQRHPQAHLCVAGDLNMSIEGPRFYGTVRGRMLLDEAMARAGLACTTTFDRVPRGLLADPAIDHVLAPRGLASRTIVAGAWEGRSDDGLRLSDHSGVVVAIEVD